MAATSAAAAVSSCHLGAFVSRDPSSKLSSLGSLRCSAVRGLGTRSRGLAMPPRSQRRILPRVEASKKTFSTFDDLLENSDVPVVVDFYTTWCGPCKYMSGVLDQLSDHLKDEIEVVKIDTEEHVNIANRYNIEALPTFIIFKNGKPCDRFEGALPQQKFFQRIQDGLNSCSASK